MRDPTLYLFDGFNLLHSSTFGTVRELTDMLAGFVAMQGARGIVVFDGHGEDATLGALQVRWAPDADTMLERLAAEHRERERVCLVSSDAAVRGTAGRTVMNMSSLTFMRELEVPEHDEWRPSRLEDRLDDETRAKLERLRRGKSS